MPCDCKKGKNIAGLHNKRQIKHNIILLYSSLHTSGVWASQLMVSLLLLNCQHPRHTLDTSKSVPGSFTRAAMALVQREWVVKPRTWHTDPADSVQEVTPSAGLQNYSGLKKKEHEKSALKRTRFCFAATVILIQRMFWGYCTRST